MRLAAFVLAFTTLASAEERTVVLAHDPTPRGVQEIATILRTVADIPKLSIDNTHLSFTMEGSAAQLDGAAWLVQQLDKPAGWRPSEQERENPSTREFRLASSEKGPILRILYLPENTSTRGMQETLTIMRTVLDVQKIFNYSSQHALAIRGTAGELAADEWLLQALEANTVSPPYPLVEGVPADLVRVFPLPPDATSPRMAQLITALRSKPLFVQKVFTRSVPPVIAVRGTAAQLDQAEKQISAFK